MRSNRKFGLALFCAAALAGCEPGATLAPLSDTEREDLIRTAQTTSPYLKPGEKVRILVFGEDRLSGEFEIDPAGYLSLPLSGTVKASGMSKAQLERELAKKFRGEYLRDPKVTVDVVGFHPFYIMGEVGRPGEFPFRSGLNVMSAIALAGGPTYRASRSTVLIKHSDETGFREYPLNAEIPILPGDLVKLPERYF
ncbi:MAG TPA: polysaccharide biosynthesis/export family protein [Methylocystis sp.]|nr:polysaccharide biosynthesis/export family protein [Methylocystis sp.]